MQQGTRHVAGLEAGETPHCGSIHVPHLVLGQLDGSPQAKRRGGEVARSEQKLGQKPTAEAGGCSAGPGDGGCALPELRRLEKHHLACFLLGENKKTTKF